MNPIKLLSDRLICRTGAVFRATVCFSLLTLLVLGFSPDLRAQTAGTGTVTGTVQNKTTGDFLEGAEIQVKGTQLSTFTQRGGTFELDRVPAGAQTLIVTYPNLDEKDITVVVPAGKSITANADLTSQVYVLNSFVVSGQREGASAAVALQKASNVEMQVAAANQFGDIPEGNIGEYLKHLPGIGISYTANDARAISLRGLSPSLTVVNVDGNPMASGSSSGDTRTFELEQVAINNVENVEIYKGVTPAMPADSTGGMVNLVTKSAFDRDRPEFSYKFSLVGVNSDLTAHETPGYGNHLSHKIYPNYEFNYERRIGKNFGFNVNFRNSEIYNDYPRARATWSYKDDPKIGSSAAQPYLSKFEMQNEQKVTRRKSFATKLDYRVGDHTTASLSGQWNWYDLLFTDRDIAFSPGTPNAGDFGDNFINGQTGKGKGKVDLSTIQRWKYGTTYNFSGVIKQTFDHVKTNISTYWSQADSKYRDTNSGFYYNATAELKGVDVYLSNLQNEHVDYRVTDKNGNPINLKDLSNYKITSLAERPYTTLDTRYGASGSVRYNFSMAIPFALESGVRVDKTLRDTSRFRWQTLQSGVSLPSDASTFQDTLYNKKMGYGYGVWPFLDSYKLYKAFPPGQTLNYAKFKERSIRHFNEQTDAGYVMADMTLHDNIKVLTGVRYETSDIKASAAGDASTFEYAYGKTKYHDFYPSINVKYTPRNNVVVRGSVTKTYGPPDYGVLIPVNEIIPPDPSSPDSSGTIKVPNPGIKPQKAINYDLGFDYYFKHAGVFSTGIFYKKISDYLQKISSDLTPALATQLGLNYSDFADNPYTVTYTENYGNATIKGIELSYSQSLDFLPGAFKGFSVQANYTYQKTKGGVTSQLEDFIPETANFVLSYSRGKYSFMLSDNYMGRTLKNTKGYAQSSDPNFFEKQYADAHNQVDLMVTYKMRRQAQFYLSVRNIFNEPWVYESFNRRYYKSEYGDPVYELGVKGRF